MIRRTVYERLFDRLAESPSVRDARPTSDHEGIEMDFVPDGLEETRHG